MILPDHWIRLMARDHGLIMPFFAEQVRYRTKDGELTDKPIISFGLSSYGYDARCGRDFKVFSNMHSSIVDPKRTMKKAFVEFNKVESVVIPPNSFALTSTVEWFKIPRDVLAVCLGKSTYARCGIIINVTPLEPEWEGNVTIEISNTSSLPARIYADEGICQFIFLKADNACEVSYKDRAGGKGGKYMGTVGVQLPLL